MVFTSSCQGQRFSTSIFSYKFLQLIWSPNVEKWTKWHYGKPVSSVLEIPSTVISMEGEHRADNDTPFNGFICGLKFKQVFQFKSIISPFLCGVILKIVLVWFFKVTNILPPKFMNLGYGLGICLCTLVKIVRVLLLKGRICLGASLWAAGSWMWRWGCVWGRKFLI